MNELVEIDFFSFTWSRVAIHVSMISCEFFLLQFKLDVKKFQFIAPWVRDTC